MAATWQLVEGPSGRLIVPELALAVTFWQRFRGLQFRRGLPAGHGLLLSPCRSIHTHWMFFMLDVAMLGADGKVLAVHHSFPPWSVLQGPTGTACVLETRSGDLIDTLPVGTTVALRGAPAVVSSGEAHPDVTRGSAARQANMRLPLPLLVPRPD